MAMRCHRGLDGQISVRPTGEDAGVKAAPLYLTSVGFGTD